MSTNSRAQFRVFTKNFPPRTTAKEIEDAFRNAGFNISGSWMPESGVFCFIDFNTLDEAERAAGEMNGFQIGGQSLTADLARPRQERTDRPGFDRQRDDRKATRSKYRLVVTNMNSRTSWQDLKDVMRGTGGEVTFTSVTQPFCGQGFAEFATEADLDNAIQKLNDSMVDGNRVKVARDDAESRDLATDPPSTRRSRRSPSPPRHRGRGRSPPPRTSRRRSPSPPRRRERERRRSGSPRRARRNSRD